MSYARMWLLSKHGEVCGFYQPPAYSEIDGRHLNKSGSGLNLNKLQQAEHS